MITAVEVKLNAFLFTVFSTRKVTVFILFTHNTDVNFERTQDIFQVLLRRVRYNLIYIFTASQLDVSFYHRLSRCIFLRPVQSRIYLQTTNEIIALSLSLFQHHDMTGMQ